MDRRDRGRWVINVREEGKDSKRDRKGEGERGGEREGGRNERREGGREGYLNQELLICQNEVVTIYTCTCVW